MKNLSAIPFVGFIALCGLIYAVEPPCQYPTCFRGEEPVETREFKGPHSRLEVHRVGRMGRVDLVLLRLVVNKLSPSEFIPGYLLANKNGNGFVFERYGKPVGSPPHVQLDAAMGKALFAKVVWSEANAPIELKYDAREKGSEKYLAQITKQYQIQLTRRDLDDALIAAEGELGKTAKRVGAACATPLVITQNRSHLAVGKLVEGGTEDLPYRCAELLNPLVDICSRRQIKSLPLNGKVECVYVLNAPSSISVSPDRTLLVHTSLTAARDGRSSFDSASWFEKWLKLANY